MLSSGGKVAAQCRAGFAHPQHRADDFQRGVGHCLVSGRHGAGPPQRRGQLVCLVLQQPRHVAPQRFIGPQLQG